MSIVITKSDFKNYLKNIIITKEQYDSFVHDFIAEMPEIKLSQKFCLNTIVSKPLLL